jgi:hypothetical protein
MGGNSVHIEEMMLQFDVLPGALAARATPIGSKTRA